MLLLIFLIYIVLIKPFCFCFLRRSFKSNLPDTLSSRTCVYHNLEPLLDSPGVFKAIDDRERQVIIKTWTSHSLSKPNKWMLHHNEISFNISKEVMRCMFFGAWINLFIKMVKVQAYIALCKRPI